MNKTRLLTFLALLFFTTAVSAQSDETKAVELPEPDEDGWISLFDGKTLGNWMPINFGLGTDVVAVEEGLLYLDAGDPMTGMKWNAPLPRKVNYEIEMVAKKIQGDDFFLALTMPVNEESCTLVCGGWGGGVVGISCLHGLDASENETATVEYFETDKWYTVKVRVEEELIQCWIDDRMLVDVDIKGVEISMRPGDIELCSPLGLASFLTSAAYRSIRWREIPAE
ncbi:MAG: family 16 glycoside hydrolase [Verrucomicrobiota bacterium]